MTFKKTTSQTRIVPTIKTGDGRILAIIAGLLIIQISILLTLVLRTPPNRSFIQSDNKICTQHLQHQMRPYYLDKYGCVVAPISLGERA